MARKMILIVEDDLATLKYETEVLEKLGYLVYGFRDIASANQAIASILRSRYKVNLSLVLVDLNINKESGEEFARRLTDIVGVNVLIVTGNEDAAKNLSFKPDGIINKPFSIATLEDHAKRLSTPLHRNNLKRDVKLNLWLATQALKGFSELKPFSRVMSGSKKRRVEKIHGLTRDGQYLSCVIYPQADVADNAIKLGFSTLLGCPEGCDFCIHPFSRDDKHGNPVKFLRRLTVGEIVGQLYLMTLSPIVQEAMRENSTLKLVVNFTCEGEGMRHNFDNLMAAILQMNHIFKPKVEFIITTVGDVAMLRKFIDEGYTNLPISFYFSLNFADLVARLLHMPGTKEDNIEEILDLLEIIGRLSGRPVTVSIAVFNWVNNTVKAVAKLAGLLKNRSSEWLKIKLQVGAKFSMKGTVNISGIAEKLETKLIAAGITQPIRIRTIEGDENSGCGRTGTHWQKNP